MIRRYLLLGCLLLALGMAIMYLYGADMPVLHPQGPVAYAERSVMIVTLLLCSIVVVPVFVLLFYFAWKYRANNPKVENHHEPDWDHTSATAEVVWWFVPTAIIVVLSIIIWQSSNALDPYKPLGEDPLVIQVVALDWKWLFIYPEQGIAMVNALELPANRPVKFVLTADAPMNSFWIPSLGGQIMVMPGMSTELNLWASHSGVFKGSSANMSGNGFSDMTFTVTSVPQNDFARWVQSVRLSSNPLTPGVYDSLALQSRHTPTTYYSSVEGNIYDRVISKFMMPKKSMIGMQDNLLIP